MLDVLVGVPSMVIGHGQRRDHDQDPDNDNASKASQSHPKATSKPVDSQPIGNLKPPQSHPKATSKPPQSPSKRSGGHAATAACSPWRPCTKLARRRPCGLLRQDRAIEP